MWSHVAFVSNRTSNEKRTLARTGMNAGECDLVHADDLLCEKTTGIFEVNVKVVGPKDHQQKEADPRHVWEIVTELRLEGAKGCTTLADDQFRSRSLEGETEMAPDETKQCRSLMTRANYLSLDRQRMSKPKHGYGI